MGKPNKSYAEAGLEEVLENTANAELNLVDTNTGDTGEEMIQVSGNEPVGYFLRFNAPKKPTKHAFKIFEKGQTILGTYERSFIAGKYNNSVHLVRLEDGLLVGLPSAGSLNKAIAKLAEGSKIKVTYDGMSEMKDGDWAGSEAHQFTVFGNKRR